VNAKEVTEKREQLRREGWGIYQILHGNTVPITFGVQEENSDRGK
jgi:hypothetical protein